MALKPALKADGKGMVTGCIVPDPHPDAKCNPQNEGECVAVSIPVPVVKITEFNVLCDGVKMLAELDPYGRHEFVPSDICEDTVEDEQCVLSHDIMLEDASCISGVVFVNGKGAAGEIASAIWCFAEYHTAIMKAGSGSSNVFVEI